MIVEDEDRSDCISLGSDDSDMEEINKLEVRDILKNLADLRRQEADCIDKLAQVVPKMEDRDVVIVSEKMQGMDLSRCVYECMRELEVPGILEWHWQQVRDSFHYAEKIKWVQTWTVPNLCRYFDVGKTKLHEILCCQKYGKDEPNRHITPVPVKEEEKTGEPPVKKTKGGKKSTEKKTKKVRMPKKKTPTSTISKPPPN